MCLRLCGAAPTSDQLILHYNQHLKYNDEMFTFGDLLDFLSKQYEMERTVDYEDIFIKYFALNDQSKQGFIPLESIRVLMFDVGLDRLINLDNFHQFIKDSIGHDTYYRQVIREDEGTEGQDEASSAPTPTSLTDSSTVSSVAAAVGSSSSLYPNVYLTLDQFMDLLKKL